MNAISVLGITALEGRFYNEQPCVVVLAGLHGEEPAPTVAVLSMLPEIERTWTFPYLVVPNANPAGIARGQPRSPFAAGSVAANAAFREELTNGRTIGLFLDLHEDDRAPSVYLFGHEGTGYAISVRNMLYAAGVTFAKDLRAWWEKDEPRLDIEEGIIWDFQDGSIDDEMSLVAPSIVVETPSSMPLDFRVAVHCRVLAHVPVLMAEIYASRRT